MDFPLIYTLPLWLDLIIFSVILLVALEIGFWLGRRNRGEGEELAPNLGPKVHRAAFLLLSLLLAFTFGDRLTSFETRKQALIAKANAFGVAFNLAGLQRERGGRELQRALLDYARAHIVTFESSISIEEAKAMQKKLFDARRAVWPATEKMLRPDAGPLESTLVVAVDDVLREHPARLYAGYDFMPDALGWSLVAVAAFVNGVGGYTAGLTGELRRWRLTGLTLVIVWIIYLIVDFDRPLRGFVRVSQQPIAQVIADMEEALKPK